MQTYFKPLPDSLLAQAKQIKLLALDVDGILSDGQLVFDANGIETKAFYVQDGLGIKLVQEAGVTVAIITGRCSNMVNQRAKSLNIAHVIQGREDKGAALAQLAKTLNINLRYCAYMGDDWQDISALNQVGLPISVPNAHAEVKKRVVWVTQQPGGHGAVREACDLILYAKGVYDDFLATFQ